MPRPIPFPVRQAVIQRFQSGESVSEMAATLQLPARSIRALLSQFQQRGESGLTPNYSHCGRRRSPENDRMCEWVLKWRKQHPKWGAGRLRVELTHKFPHETLPSERTLGRWLCALGETPAPPGRPAKFEYVRASSPHDVWQVDAGEQKKLASGKMVSWLRFVDECSGAVLRTFVFSPRALQLRSRSGRAEAFSPCFSGVGLARLCAGGQRGAVGFSRRHAAAFEFVALRIARQIDLESPAPTAIQWGRGAVQSVGERLGRTGTMSNRSPVATSHQPRRPSAAGRVSRLRRTLADRHLCRTQRPSPPLHSRLGEKPLEFRVGQGIFVALCSSPARGWFGKNRFVRRQVVCGDKIQTSGRAAAFRPHSPGMGGEQSAKPTTRARARPGHQQAIHFEFASEALNPFLTNGRTLCRDFGRTLCHHFAAELYVG
jgi:transposase